MNEDWHKIVYKRNDQEEFPREVWTLIRNRILTRDDYTCLRCDKEFKKRELSVHHLVPRAEGGSNDWTNLVTLCLKCHDYVEMEELRTKAAIMGSYEIETTVDVPIKPIKYDAKGRREESFQRPEWHKYVYGGKKRRNRRN